MTRAPKLAPSWLPRHERRRIDNELYKLLHTDNCSICGSPLRHNSRTMSGFDAHGTLVLAGECCSDRVTISFGMGHYCNRAYDFLSPTNTKSSINTKWTNEQIVEAIAVRQKAIADTDKRLEGIERRGGSIRATHVGRLEHPWTRDDREWFEKNPSRSHRMRLPFPDEFNQMKAKIPAGCAMIVLVRQITPGDRMKTVIEALIR
jgi:hypothetical protein